jgi:hypothetical protein
VKSNEQRFGWYLLLCLGTTLAICIAVEGICLSYGVAPLFTPNLPFNEKLRFVRDHRPGSAPIGVISGASIALNDIDGDLLEEQEHQPFIDLGANAMPVQSSQHLYEQFAAIFPTREVIFAVAPFELRDGFRANIDVPTDVFGRYVLGKMSLAEEFAYRDLSGMLSYWKNWKDYHSRRAPTSLVFSKTGDVPLDIDRSNADPRMWNGEAIAQDMTCLHCMEDLAAFCGEVRGQGHSFTVVLGPLRPEVLERIPQLRDIEDDRRVRIRASLQGCGGTLFDVSEFAVLDDACFANSVHLNGRGMHAVTALLVRFRRGEHFVHGVSPSCAVPEVATSSSPESTWRQGERDY